jgi:hypothetical protein
MSPLQALFESAFQRPLTPEEVSQMEAELQANNVAVAEFFSRCQLESDLYLHFGRRAAKKTLLADRGALTDHFEDKRLPRPADATE